MSESLENASIDKILEHVGEGKLIRSDVFKWMIERIRELEGRVGSGNRVDVPNFIGRTLRDARIILDESSVQLRLGPVLDVEGQSVDPEEEADEGRIVLMQTPDPGGQTTANRLIRLLVATAEDEPLPNPEIEGFDPEPVRVREDVTIHGENFSSPWESERGDRVTFEGVEGTVKVEQSHEGALVVRVPEDIPGVPDRGEEVTEINVTVTARGNSDSDTLEVQPPSGQEIPQIDDVVAADEGNIRVGGAIEIRGSGFAEAPSDNAVLYGTVERSATDVTSQGIVAPVPGASELGLSGSRTINVKVKVENVESEAEPVFISVPDDE